MLHTRRSTCTLQRVAIAQWQTLRTPSACTVEDRWCAPVRVWPRVEKREPWFPMIWNVAPTSGEGRLRRLALAFLSFKMFFAFPMCLRMTRALGLELAVKGYGFFYVWCWWYALRHVWKVLVWAHIRGCRITHVLCGTRNMTCCTCRWDR